MAGISAVIFSSSAMAAPGELPSREEMWEIIKMQNEKIDALTKRVEGNEAKVVETEEKVEATNQVMEEELANVATGSGPGWWDRTSIGGYGELHLNKGSTTDKIDFHRYVLFVGHEFDENIRMFSEFELEHAIAGDGKTGEIELEQAFIEFDLNDHNQAQAGVFLIPIGILNETHEPPTFFGVERNPVENRIVPSTWWEGGVKVSGDLGSGFGYDVALHSGLAVDPTTFTIRGGRQKVGNAIAEDGAATARLRFSQPGVKLAATAQFQDDITQGVPTATDTASATLFETNADIRHGGFGLRALAAMWDIDGSQAKALGRDEQYGFYVEPSFRFEILEDQELGFFARFNQYDMNAGNNLNTMMRQYDFGANWWPHPDVVIKADVAILDNPSGTSGDEIGNLGIGWQF